MIVLLLLVVVFVVVVSSIAVAAYAATKSGGVKFEASPPVDPLRDKLGKVLPVLKEAASGNCKGTVYKKRGECKNARGDILDGSPGKCGKGKESWALDTKDPGYKREFGPLGACPNFEDLRDCEVPCPRPCEGDTWKKGRCVRKDVNGKIVAVLDGTPGKCGDGMLDLQLDTDAPDYKPAVGSGSCITKTEKPCFVKCPKPEPPKCSYVTAGWTRNRDIVGDNIGCVTSKALIAENLPKLSVAQIQTLGYQTPASDGSYTAVRCGKKGWRQEYKASTLNTEKCDTLSRWVSCDGPVCPVDCVGSWSQWSACTLPKGEVCGLTKTRQTYRVTQQKNATGRACPNGWYDGQVIEKTCGQSQSISCCNIGQWKNKGGCKSNGKQTQTRTVVGCDASTRNTQEIDCCYTGPWSNKGCVGTDGFRKETRVVTGICGYGTKNERLVKDLTACCKQSGTWKDSSACTGRGEKVQKQTTEGNCPASAKSRVVPCEYVGPWKVVQKTAKNWRGQTVKLPTCDEKTGKKSFTRVTKNSNKATSKTEDCPVDCRGYHDWPACPTKCGTPASTIPRKWITTVKALNGGKACTPGTATRRCRGTAVCPACKWVECKDWSWDRNGPCTQHIGSRPSMYWNDGMSSYELKEGCENWEMRAYEHGNYSGQYFVMQPGGRKDLNGPIGWYNDRISSVKAVPK